MLCPGPSLASFDGCCSDYDITIGVNRAASAYACDYYVALDAKSYEMAAPLGEPVIVTVKHSLAEMCQRHPELTGRAWMPYSDAGCDIASNFGAFSSTAALVLAHHLGASTVHVYGADMAGEADFDGYENPQNRRDALRWAKEARQWVALVDELAGKGTRVVRVLQEVACLSI